MIAWAIEALIASAMLMGFVLVARGTVSRAFGPGVAYALWALPALRLILPPLPRLVSLQGHAAPALVRQTSETITYYLIEPLAGSPSMASPLAASLGVGLVIVWSAGAAAFLGWHTLNHWRFCQRMIETRTSSARAGGIHVIETDAATGPLAFGIFHRYVAFPRDFAERYDAEERELALAHELGHHHRGDLIANWLALGVLALHWFNPLAWRAFRAFRADQEMANDARVLAGRNPIDRHTYACAIVKAAHGGAVSAACHLHTIQDLKGRLRMLTTGRRSRLRLALGSTAVVSVMIGGLAATASGTSAAATMRAGVEKATGIDISRLDANLQSRSPMPLTPEGDPLPPPPEPTNALPPISRRVAPAQPGTVAVTDVQNGQHGERQVKVVRLGRDGELMNDDFHALRDVPEVSSMTCDGGVKARVISKKMVVNEVKDGKRITIICTDRIQRVAMTGAAEAGRSKEIQRQAYVKALVGLRGARDRIANNPSMTRDQKKDALEGIDGTIREMEATTANPD